MKTTPKVKIYRTHEIDTMVQNSEINRMKHTVDFFTFVDAKWFLLNTVLFVLESLLDKFVLLNELVFLFVNLDFVVVELELFLDANVDFEVLFNKLVYSFSTWVNRDFYWFDLYEVIT